MVCLICERGVQGNDIGFGVQFFKRNIFREIFYAGVFAAAVSQSAAAEAGQLLYNSASDLPGPMIPTVRSFSSRPISPPRE